MSDLIEREDAIEVVCELVPIRNDAVEIADAIRAIPSAERKGEWIDAGTDLDGTHYYRCSNCGWEVETDYPNCPYCTAKMKGAEDE